MVECIILIGFMCNQPSITWTYPSPNNGVVAASPAIADVDTTSTGSEIIFPASSIVYCLSSNGNLLWSFDAGQFMYSSPIIANLGAPGDPAIIIIDFGGEVYCLNNDGTEKWAVFFPLMHGDNSPAVANINTIGTPEILFSTLDSLYCLNSDGTIRWSAQVSNYDQVCCGTSPSIGDVDLDNEPEVVFGDWCFEADGTLR